MASVRWPANNKNPWVLVVDDVRSALVLAERMLRANGYQVVVKETIADALVELDKNRIYSAVVSDWLFKKGEGNGLTFLKMVRSWYGKNGIACILWTVDPAGCVLARDEEIACIEKTGSERADFLKVLDREIRGYGGAA
jgi:CheY-like chemotaxis protein